MQNKYKRILLKISGEALKGDNELYNADRLRDIASQLIKLSSEGLEIAVVIGGGNIWRGSSAKNIGMDRISGDYMGMLATIMNALALESVIKRLNHSKIVVCSALETNKVTEPYFQKKIIHKLSNNYIVILSAGLGHPYFTTDSAASLRAIETGADVLLMAKNDVGGVYTSDPLTDQTATHIPEVKLTELIELKLNIMDQTASTLALDGQLDMVVFNINAKNSIYDAAHGRGQLTKIKGE